MISPKKATKKDKLLKIGVVGTGGRGLYAFISMLSGRNDARVTALADPNPLRMKSVAKTILTPIRCYPNAEELFRCEKLDGAIITSPDYTHETNALAAIKHRIPVLVDKPLATTSAGCLRIIRAARQNKVEVSVGFNLRHVPVLKKVKEFIAGNELGRLMLIENQEFYDGGRTYMSRWNRMYKWSGGLWVHKGSHDFDIFNWWNPDGKPVRVSAFAGLNALRPNRIPFRVEKKKPVGPHCSECFYAKRCPDKCPPYTEGTLYNPAIIKEDNYRPDLCVYASDKDTHDNGIAIVEYDNNVRASHLECFVANFSDRRYTVVGEKGVLEISLENPTEFKFRPRWSKEDRVIHVPPAGDGGHGGSDPELLDIFLNSLKSGAVSSSTAGDGIRSVAVGEAAEISWRNHRMVEISELVDLSDPLFNTNLRSNVE